MHRFWFVLCTGICAALPYAAAHAQEERAQDGCVLELQQPSSTTLGSAGVQTVMPPTLIKAERTLKHTIRLPSGVSVAYAVGGCAHYVYTYTFRPLSLPATRGKALFDFIRKQIAEVPFAHEDSREGLLDMVAALERADAASKPWNTQQELSVEGDVTYTLRLDKDGFVLVYDFPL